MLATVALTLALTMPLPQAPEPCVPVSVVQRIIVQPPYHAPTKALLWSGTALAMMDVSRSMYEIGASRAYEQNPILRPVQNRPEAFALAKFAGYAAVTSFLLHIKPKHPKAALWGAIAYNVIGTAIVVRNYRTAHASPR